MARKKKEEEVIKPVVEVKEVKVDEVKDIKEVCHHCGVDSGRLICSKGDHNQYKFCSTNCYNLDKTV